MNQKKSPLRRVAFGLAFALSMLATGSAWSQSTEAAPIGVHIDKYLDIPEEAKGPPVDPAKGYRIQELGKGLFMVTDNAYQSMFIVHETGVVVIDAPPSYAAKINQAIAEVTDKPITHLVYSHFHADHIGGAAALGGNPVIVAHEETKRQLVRANDPKRPVPAKTFTDTYTLKAGGQILELSYHGVAHAPGNIFIYAPAQKTLMVVDVIFPGWMPWRRFALAQDIAGYFAQVEAIDRVPFDTLVAGHVARVGRHADVKMQLEFINDVKTAAAAALGSVKYGEGLNPSDASNPWAGADSYIDRVAAQCVSSLTSKWKTRLAAFDTFIWDQCYAMEQSLRID